MKSVRFRLLAPAVLALIALAGSTHAAETHRPIKAVTVPQEDPVPVTKQQLVDAGATCTGETCTFKNTTWDCANPSSCFVEKTN